jgi:choline dehydrogenase-like flavoprotein
MSAPAATRGERVQVLIIGSGAGGATTCLELAQRGIQAVLLEEGDRVPLDLYGASSPVAMNRLYRRRGMTPILGSVPIGYVEGRCLGGSTEINSGFWHRTPPEILLRWKAQFELDAATPEELLPHFEWAERICHIGTAPYPWPPSTQVFADGIAKMQWSAQEVPRAAHDCRQTNACAAGCPKGAKQGMSRRVLAEAEAAGARIIPNCRVQFLIRQKKRVVGAIAELLRSDGTHEIVRIEADHVFVCAGPTETPALLRRSGIKVNVGASFRIHPMLKVAARFGRELNAQHAVLPLLQVKEFWPEISMGGSFFTGGHLAMTLSDNWPETRAQMAHARHMATYYVAVRGSGPGSVRPSLSDGGSVLRYELSNEDLFHLSQGLGRLATLLLAGGAEEVFPCVYGLPSIRTELDAIRWLDEKLPRSRLGLTTVHAFSTCPIGERQDRCAADSFGKVFGCENLYINDASMLPDSPGVNPMGSIMALARRNVFRFMDQLS